MLIVHIFDPFTSNYTQKMSFKPTECQTITNVAVGRSTSTLRLFVTCLDTNRKTALRLYDRNMNGEITMPSQEAKEDAAPQEPPVVVVKTTKPKAKGGKRDLAAEEPKEAGDVQENIKKTFEKAKTEGGKIIDEMILQNHMVYKTGNMKTLVFLETPHVF